MACKDIIVNINNFNTEDTFTITVRLKASLARYTILPTYTQVAVANQTLFANLPDGEYEVCVQRVCKKGGQSDFICQDTVAANCQIPEDFLLDDDSGIDNPFATGASFEWTEDTSASYEYKLNRDDWKPTPQNDNLDLTVLNTGEVYQLHLRKVCGTFMRSAAVSINFPTLVLVPTVRVDILEKICNGNEFTGYYLRFSFTGGMAAAASHYRIRFTDIDGNVNTVVNRLIGGGDNLADIVTEIANIFHPVNLIIGSNYAAFDIVSRERKSAPGTIINCQDIPLVTGYSIDII